MFNLGKKPATVDEQPTATDGADEESPATPLSLSEAIRAIGLEDMTSLDLAVLITARHRTVRQALKAAAILASRSEWHHLEDCADMLCRSYEPGEQLLGLHLIRRFQAVDPTMHRSLISLVRSLARHADSRIAREAQTVLEETSEAE